MRRGRGFWQMLSDQVDRGERVADVARHHRVQPKTLSWWRWKLRSEDHGDARLLPVVVSSPEQRDEPRFELRIRDVVIRVAGDADVTYLAALVDALRG